MWNLIQTVQWYRHRGAPGDQQELRNLLREVQEACGGLDQAIMEQLAQALDVKVSFLVAVAKRTPGLALEKGNVLELCAGVNCGRHKALREFAQSLPNVKVKLVGCMRLCGKGPNVRFNGKLYHGADPALLKRLTEE